MLYSILFNENLGFYEAIIIFFISIIVFFFSLTLHEYAHGAVAYVMGDKTPKNYGRLSLNPFKHIDPTGFVFFILFGVGWAKPMPVNPLNFKRYRKGIRLTSISGVAVNFILGLVASIGLAVIYATIGAANLFMEFVIFFLQYVMLINSFLVMYNILPIYPLDGFNFATSFMRGENKFIKYSVKNGFKILLGILLANTLIDLLFNYDILASFLSLIYTYIYQPISLLGV